METTAPRADNSTSCLHILKKKTLTIIILIMANHYLDLLIACCNRGQTSDIHGTFQVFVAMASWQNVEACMLVPITMYRTITHSLGLSWSLSLDSLLVTHSWLHSEKSRIDWHFLPQVWVAINIQTRRRLVDLFIMYTSHPPTMIDFHRRKKKYEKDLGTEIIEAFNWKDTPFHCTWTMKILLSTKDDKWRIIFILYSTIHRHAIQLTFWQHTNSDILEFSISSKT